MSEIKKIPAEEAARIDAVMNAMTPHAHARTSRENVADVLAAIAVVAPYKIFDPIASIKSFNLAAGNTVDQINPRQSALYTGLQLEELAEKIAAVGITNYSDAIQQTASSFKCGIFDRYFEIALQDPAAREAMLDADCDLIVVSAGAAFSQGADLAGALREVCASQDSKKDETGMIPRDANGKFIKGPNYRAPNLAPFIIQSERNENGKA